MNEKELKDISYYKIENNSLDKLSFGGNPYGMNGCLPPEPLHQLNQGVFKKLIDYFEDCLTTISKTTFDKFVRYLAMNCHRQSTRDYPDIGLFKDGIDKCQLTGSEIITKVFMLYLCLCQTYIIECLPTIEINTNERFKNRKTKISKPTADIEQNNINTTVESTTITKHFYKKIGHSTQHLKEWIKLFEATLCFDAWVHQHEFDMSDFDEITTNDSKADIAVREYLKLYTKLIDCHIGNGTNTSKIHWLLHIPHYIRWHGPPKAYSGQTPEHCLSPMVKWAARLTQLRPSSLIEQSCERYYENHVIQRAHDMLVEQNVVQGKQQNNDKNIHLHYQHDTTNTRSYVVIGRYRVHFNSNMQFTNIEWLRSGNKASTSTKPIIPNTHILNDMIVRLHTDEFDLQSNYVDCFTTLYTMDIDSNGITDKHMYRADTYFFKRPWNDWCETKWDADGVSGKYPSRLMLFIDTSNMTFNNFDNVEHPYLALVRASEPDARSTTNRKNKDCILIDSFESDKYIRVINCESIVKPIFVIPDINKIQTINQKTHFKSGHRIQMKDKHTWGNKFINTSWK